MRNRTLPLVLIASVVSVSLPASASSLPAAATIPANARLTLAEESALAEMIAQHRRVQSRLPEADRNLADALTALVKRQLFAAPLRGDLLAAATRIVSQLVPALSTVEAASLAEYSLGGIASDTSLSPTDLAMQQGFNEQLIKLQMSMQRENLIFTSVSNVLKTRHDTVKNSIGNVR